jgi:hypothetical protein
LNALSEKIEPYFNDQKLVKNSLDDVYFCETHENTRYTSNILSIMRTTETSEYSNQVKNICFNEETDTTWFSTILSNIEFKFNGNQDLVVEFWFMPTSLSTTATNIFKIDSFSNASSSIVTLYNVKISKNELVIEVNNIENVPTYSATYTLTYSFSNLANMITPTNSEYNDYNSEIFEEGYSTSGDFFEEKAWNFLSIRFKVNGLISVSANYIKYLETNGNRQEEELLENFPLRFNKAYPIPFNLISSSKSLKFYTLKTFYKRVKIYARPESFEILNRNKFSESTIYDLKLYLPLNGPAYPVIEDLSESISNYDFTNNTYNLDTTFPREYSNIFSTITNDDNQITSILTTAKRYKSTIRTNLCKFDASLDVKTNTCLVVKDNYTMFKVRSTENGIIIPIEKLGLNLGNSWFISFWLKIQHDYYFYEDFNILEQNTCIINSKITTSNYTILPSNNITSKVLKQLFRLKYNVSTKDIALFYRFPIDETNYDMKQIAVINEDFNSQFNHILISYDEYNKLQIYFNKQKLPLSIPLDYTYNSNLMRIIPTINSYCNLIIGKSNVTIPSVRIPEVFYISNFSISDLPFSEKYLPLIYKNVQSPSLFSFNLNFDKLIKDEIFLNENSYMYNNSNLIVISQSSEIALMESPFRNRYEQKQIIEDLCPSMSINDMKNSYSGKCLKNIVLELPSNENGWLFNLNKNIQNEYTLNIVFKVLSPSDDLIVFILGNNNKSIHNQVTNTNESEYSILVKSMLNGSDPKLTITYNDKFSKQFLKSDSGYDFNQWNILFMRSMIINNNLLKNSVSLYNWKTGVTNYKSSIIPFDSYVDNKLLLSLYDNFSSKINGIIPKIQYQYIKIWDEPLSDAVQQQIRGKYQLLDSFDINTYFDFRFFIDIENLNFYEGVSDKKFSVSSFNTSYSTNGNIAKLVLSKDTVICSPEESQVIVTEFDPISNSNVQVNRCKKNMPLYFADNTKFLDLNFPISKTVLNFSELTIEMWFSINVSLPVNTKCSFVYNQIPNTSSINQIDISITNLRKINARLTDNNNQITSLENTKEITNNTWVYYGISLNNIEIDSAVLGYLDAAPNFTSNTLSLTNILFKYTINESNPKLLSIGTSRTECSQLYVRMFRLFTQKRNLSYETFIRLDGNDYSSLVYNYYFNNAGNFVYNEVKTQISEEIYNDSNISGTNDLKYYFITPIITSNSPIYQSLLKNNIVDRLNICENSESKNIVDQYSTYGFSTTLHSSELLRCIPHRTHNTIMGTFLNKMHYKLDEKIIIRDELQFDFWLFRISDSKNYAQTIFEYIKYKTSDNSYSSLIRVELNSNTIKVVLFSNNYNFEIQNLSNDRNNWVFLSLSISFKDNYISLIKSKNKNSLQIESIPSLSAGNKNDLTINNSTNRIFIGFNTNFEMHFDQIYLKNFKIYNAVRNVDEVITNANNYGKSRFVNVIESNVSKSEDSLIFSLKLKYDFMYSQDDSISYNNYYNNRNTSSTNFVRMNSMVQISDPGYFNQLLTDITSDFKEDGTTRINFKLCDEDLVFVNDKCVNTFIPFDDDSIEIILGDSTTHALYSPSEFTESFIENYLISFWFKMPDTTNNAFAVFFLNDDIFVASRTKIVVRGVDITIPLNTWIQIFLIKNSNVYKVKYATYSNTITTNKSNFNIFSPEYVISALSTHKFLNNELLKIGISYDVSDSYPSRFRLKDFLFCKGSYDIDFDMFIHLNLNKSCKYSTYERLNHFIPKCNKFTIEDNKLKNCSMRKVDEITEISATRFKNATLSIPTPTISFTLTSWIFFNDITDTSGYTQTNNFSTSTDTFTNGIGQLMKRYEEISSGTIFELSKDTSNYSKLIFSLKLILTKNTITNKIEKKEYQSIEFSYHHRNSVTNTNNNSLIISKYKNLNNLWVFIGFTKNAYNLRRSIIFDNSYKVSKNNSNNDANIPENYENTSLILSNNFNGYLKNLSLMNRQLSEKTLFRRKFNYSDGIDIASFKYRNNEVFYFFLDEIYGNYILNNRYNQLSFFQLDNLILNNNSLSRSVLPHNSFYSLYNDSNTNSTINNKEFCKNLFVFNILTNKCDKYDIYNPYIAYKPAQPTKLDYFTLPNSNNFYISFYIQSFQGETIDSGIVGVESYFRSFLELQCLYNNSNTLWSKDATSIIRFKHMFFNPDKTIRNEDLDIELENNSYFDNSIRNEKYTLGTLKIKNQGWRWNQIVLLKAHMYQKSTNSYNTTYEGSSLSKENYSSFDNSYTNIIPHPGGSTIPTTFTLYTNSKCTLSFQNSTSDPTETPTYIIRNLKIGNIQTYNLNYTMKNILYYRFSRNEVLKPLISLNFDRMTFNEIENNGMSSYRAKFTYNNNVIYQIKNYSEETYYDGNMNLVSHFNDFCDLSRQYNLITSSNFNNNTTNKTLMNDYTSCLNFQSLVVKTAFKSNGYIINTPKSNLQNTTNFTIELYVRILSNLPTTNGSITNLLTFSVFDLHINTLKLSLNYMINAENKNLTISTVNIIEDTWIQLAISVEKHSENIGTLTLFNNKSMIHTFEKIKNNWLKERGYKEVTDNYEFILNKNPTAPQHLDIAYKYIRIWNYPLNLNTLQINKGKSIENDRSLFFIYYDFSVFTNKFEVNSNNSVRYFEAISRNINDRGKFNTSLDFNTDSNLNQYSTTNSYSNPDYIEVCNESEEFSENNSTSEYGFCKKRNSANLVLKNKPIILSTPQNEFVIEFDSFTIDMWFKVNFKTSESITTYINGLPGNPTIISTSVLRSRVYDNLYGVKQELIFSKTTNTFKTKLQGDYTINAANPIIKNVQEETISENTWKYSALSINTKKKIMHGIDNNKINKGSFTEDLSKIKIRGITILSDENQISNLLTLKETEELNHQRSLIKKLYMKSLRFMKTSLSLSYMLDLKYSKIDLSYLESSIYNFYFDDCYWNENNKMLFNNMVYNRKFNVYSKYDGFNGIELIKNNQNVYLVRIEKEENLNLLTSGSITDINNLEDDYEIEDSKEYRALDRMSLISDQDYNNENILCDFNMNVKYSEDITSFLRNNNSYVIPDTVHYNCYYEKSNSETYGTLIQNLEFPFTSSQNITVEFWFFPIAFDATKELFSIKSGTNILHTVKLTSNNVNVQINNINNTNGYNPSYTYDFNFTNLSYLNDPLNVNFKEYSPELLESKFDFNGDFFKQNKWNFISLRFKLNSSIAIAANYIKYLETNSIRTEDKLISDYSHNFIKSYPINESVIVNSKSLKFNNYNVYKKRIKVFSNAEEFYILNRKKYSEPSYDSLNSYNLSLELYLPLDGAQFPHIQDYSTNNINYNFIDNTNNAYTANFPYFFSDNISTNIVNTFENKTNFTPLNDSKKITSALLELDAYHSNEFKLCKFDSEYDINSNSCIIKTVDVYAPKIKLNQGQLSLPLVKTGLNSLNNWFLSFWIKIDHDINLSSDFIIFGQHLENSPVVNNCFTLANSRFYTYSQLDGSNVSSKISQTGLILKYSISNKALSLINQIMIQNVIYDLEIFTKVVDLENKMNHLIIEYSNDQVKLYQNLVNLNVTFTLIHNITIASVNNTIKIIPKFNNQCNLVLGKTLTNLQYTADQSKDLFFINSIALSDLPYSEKLAPIFYKNKALKESSVFHYFINFNLLLNDEVIFEDNAFLIKSDNLYSPNGKSFIDEYKLRNSENVKDSNEYLCDTLLPNDMSNIYSDNCRKYNVLDIPVNQNGWVLPMNYDLDNEFSIDLSFKIVDPTDNVIVLLIGRNNLSSYNQKPLDASSDEYSLLLRCVNSAQPKLEINFKEKYSKFFELADSGFKLNQWNIVSIRSTIINTKLIKNTASLYNWSNGRTYYKASIIPYDRILDNKIIIGLYNNYATRNTSINPIIKFQYIRIWNQPLSDAILDQ